MDEHTPSAFGWFPVEQRYEVPDSSVADQPKVWGESTLQNCSEMVLRR